jgi:arginine-tRNA-protein transferase
VNPPEIIVFDSPHPCSYLPERTARLPHRHPVEMLAPERFDQCLAEGDRRSGVYLYRTQCPTCRDCQPLRLEISRFRPDATQRRTQRRGDDLLDVRVGPPAIDHARIALFNCHRDGRGLGRGDMPIDAASYADFLTNTCCQTLELSYWHDRRLVAVAIADAGLEAVSAVYCYFDPGFKLLSLGTYSVLRHVRFCQETNRRFLYLGFYIAQSPHMAYKARYRPHQRLIGGVWNDFD